MEFKPEAVDPFKILFDQIKSKVASYKGCQQLSLLQVINDSNIIFTYSVWDDEEALERYRSSETFTHIWAETQKGFSKRAEAWTMNKLFDSTSDII